MGSGPGDQVVIFSPIDGQRMVVAVPNGVKEGSTFTVQSAPATQTAWSPDNQQQQAVQSSNGLAVGQLVPVDTDGDGINESFGVLYDTDGDGIPDAVAVDINNDGIADMFIPMPSNSGNQGNMRVTSVGVDSYSVTVPPNAQLSLKAIVDAVESFVEQEIEGRHTASNVEEVDFTTQFVKVSQQAQWINGTFQAQAYQPQTMLVTVPDGVLPGQTFTVAPPPNYAVGNTTPISVTLPPNANPGSQIQVVLPDLLPMGQEIPVAAEAGGTGNSAPALDPKWELPPGQGTLDNLLAASGNVNEIRVVETETFDTNE
jgi:hypothetical protein